MRTLLRRRWRWATAVAAVCVIAATAAVWWSSGTQDYTTEDITVSSGGPEPVDLDATLYLPAATPAPAVLLAHGFGGTKETVAEQAETLASAGYVVLAYTARGFGASGGLIHLNAPDYEVADASALLDALAERDEVELDGPGDPRAAAVGGSYGGALSLLLAGHDERVDAVAASITWNDLADALFPNAVDGPESGVFKRSWAGVFYATGLAGGPPGATVPGLDPACGRWSPDVCAAYGRIAASGIVDDESRALLDASSPASVLDRITAPTLLVQGQADSLFGLDQADANAAGIVNAPVRVAWYGGGHDATGTPNDRRRVDGITLDWLSRHLDGDEGSGDDAFTFTRIGGVNSRRADLATIGMSAPDYPGLSGADDAVELPLSSAPQTIASPPDGTPAAISSVPALGELSTLANGRFTQDIPGQFAAFETGPVDEQTDVVGAPTVTIRAASPTGEAVLFAKLYDVDPSGAATLPNGLIAPIRLTDLPANVEDAEPVAVDLPGIVHRVEPGHSLRLVLATADQSYAGPVEPVEYTVDVAGSLSLPLVPAETLPSEETAWTTALVVVLVGLPAIALTAWIVARVRHRRRDRTVAVEHVDTPLVVSGLRKVYADGYVAVEGVDYSVHRGQVVGLLGPNGAGKTTSLRVLMGLLQPTEGEMRVFGHRVTPGAPVLSRLGALVEGPGLLPHLSGMDNLRLYWRSTGRPEEEARFDRVVEIADLGDRIHRKVRTYSHGMKQRIAIAQAMLGLPELLVLDEPTDGLDPPQIAAMRRVLHDYASEGRAVLVSSHLLAEVEQTCTHVVVMSRGRVVGAGTVADVIGGGDGQRLEDAFLELVE